MKLLYLFDFYSITIIVVTVHVKCSTLISPLQNAVKPGDWRMRSGATLRARCAAVEWRSTLLDTTRHRIFPA